MIGIKLITLFPITFLIGSITKKQNKKTIYLDFRNEINEEI